MATLYERLGGETAVAAAVEAFYARVLADERLSPFFRAVDLRRLFAKQKAFLTLAFGGPLPTTPMDLRRAHTRLVQHGLDDRHFDAVLEHLGDTLEALGVDEELRREAAAIAEGVRPDVLGRSASAAS